MLENQTPYEAERAWVRDSNGAERWIVAVKGTFNIHPDGTTSLAAKQDGVTLAPVYAGASDRRHLLYDTDLTHRKPTTDVIVHGHAYNHQNKPAQSVGVRLTLGEIRKTLRVWGDRVWERGTTGLRISEALPFQRMAITYERAFGGVLAAEAPEQRSPYPRNPAGVGLAASAAAALGVALPNIELPGEEIRSWRDRPAPAGFGPLAPHWSPRVECAGTYDGAWLAERAPLLPADYDEHHALSSPADQWPRIHLRGGELVELVHLTPSGALRFHLPRVVLGFETHFRDEVVHHVGTLHSVIVEPDFPRVMLVWHSTLTCHSKVHRLRFTLIRRKRLLNTKGEV